MLRPELNEQYSDIINSITDKLYPSLKLSANQTTNILLGILIENISISELQKTVKLCAQKAIKINLKRIEKVN